FAERMKFTSMAIFSVVWGLFIYCPIAHWVWSGTGWLSEFNKAAQDKLSAGEPTGFYFPAIDFAGGLVVHISSGVSALVCALMIGKRVGFPKEPMPPHNLTYTCIGTGLLWVGWFGFNGGSQVAADGRAVNAVLVTHLAASAGVLSWSLAEWLKHGKAGILGACSGAVAGLVCITPAAGSVTSGSAILMGLAAGVVCFLCCTKLKNHFDYDDSLDAFGVHGIGGTLGAVLTGVFATSAVTGLDHSSGLLEGNPGQLLTQLISVIAAVAFSAVGTVIIYRLLDSLVGMRVEAEHEVQGLDISQHGEEGYIFQ
ncbi:MAG: ammonium transporter, partial [Planctomycetaceae bacterium]